MRLSLRFGLLAVVSVFLFLSLASNTVFSASHVVECSTDIAQENKERQLILSCMPGFGTDYDQVLITSLSEPFDPSQPWSSNVDYTDEIWELDAGADGSIQLAIEFQRAAETIVASIFDDMDGDGQIRTRIVGGRLEVDEAPYPPLRVIVNGDWFLAGGQPNWNVRFVTDGASIPHIHNYVLTRAMDRYFVLDGQPDSELEFVDEDNDGVPERALWRVTATLPERAGFGRSFLWVNANRSRPQLDSGILFWPYLAAAVEARSYFDTAPAAIVDWTTGNIRQLSFSGYPIEHGFHMYSVNGIEKGELNYTNFENAMAYYDLADDRDGVPELHIRHRYFDAYDPHGWSLPSPINDIRWSWDQTNDTAGRGWDYKLGLAGTYQIESQVEFSDFSYITIPYQELPTWVLERDWAWATFVAREEAAPSTSSEGIYLWSAVGEPVGQDPTALSRFLAGQIEIDPREAYQQGAPGWRAEFAPNFGRPPSLYYSSVDRRLHLAGAEYGIWEHLESEGRQTRYEDLDGDGYFDHWRLFEGEQLLQELALAGGYLLYAENGWIELKRFVEPPLLFEVGPPTNNAERQALGEKLTQYAGASDGELLIDRFAREAGHNSRLQGVTLEDWRVRDHGFQAYLRVDSGFEVTGFLSSVIQRAEEERFILNYDGEEFEILPAVPPELELTLTLPDSKPIEVGVMQPLLVEVSNSGLVDARNRELIVSISQGTEETVLARRVLTLPAGTAERILVDLTALRIGTIQIYARLTGSENATSQVSTMDVTVNGARAITGSALLDPTGNRFGYLTILALVMLILIVFTVIVGGLISAERADRG